MTKAISEITQEQIVDLESTVSNYVDEGYDLVAQQMHEASVSWAEENDFDSNDVNEIVEIDNFSIIGDQRQIKMYVQRIKGWNPEHRARLIELLSK